jgi:hypothetical protein
MGAGRFGGMERRFAAAVCVIAIAWASHATSAEAQNNKFDGIYVGLQTLTEKPAGGNYSQCLKGPFKRQLVVKAGTASYTYNPTYQGQVAATVSADGDVRGSSSEPTGGVGLAGKIDGDNFTGEVWSLYCTYSVDLKRAP